MMMKQNITTILEILGFGFLIAAASTVGLGLGLLVAGVSLLIIGYLAGRQG